MSVKKKIKSLKKQEKAAEKKLRKLVKKDASNKKVIKRVKKILSLQDQQNELKIEKSKSKKKTKNKITAEELDHIFQVSDNGDTKNESTSMNVVEANKMISSLGTADEVMAFVKNEQRKTVLKKASDKIDRLK